MCFKQYKTLLNKILFCIKQLIEGYTEILSGVL